MLVRRATESQDSESWGWGDWLLWTLFGVCVGACFGLYHYYAPEGYYATRSRGTLHPGGRTTESCQGSNAVGQAPATSSRVPEQNDVPPAYELAEVQPAVIKVKRNDVADMV